MGNFKSELQLAKMSRVDDRARDLPVADEKLGHGLEGALRRREPDAQQMGTREGFQPFQ